MQDFRILLRNVRPYAGLFALAVLLMALAAVFEAGRTALLKSIIDALPAGGSPGPPGRIDVQHDIPAGVNAWPFIAGLLPVFTFVRGFSEYASNVLMWRI